MGTSLVSRTMGRKGGKINPRRRREAHPWKQAWPWALPGGGRIMRPGLREAGGANETCGKMTDLHLILFA